jgi:hypothetical protein
MQRNDRWYGSSSYRADDVVATLAKPEPRESRPVFMVNPPIILTLNDDMAADLAAYLRSTSATGQMPSHIYAFMRQLENDLAAARS